MDCTWSLTSPTPPNPRLQAQHKQTKAQRIPPLLLPLKAPGPATKAEQKTPPFGATEQEIQELRALAAEYRGAQAAFETSAKASCPVVQAGRPGFPQRCQAN